MNEYNICALVRKAEQDYITGTTTIGKYVQFSQYENIEKIDAYLNSKHTSGLLDSLGREKPFFNIVTGAVNIWYRATDIDRKNIRIKATKQRDYVAAFLATVKLQEWMKRDNFGAFLNDWGRSLARYGSSVVKFVEKKGRLHAMVVPWNRLITDTVDFENNPKIEKLFYTPAQLKRHKAYDQNMVDALLKAREARKTLDGQKKDNKNDYIEVFEVHGLFPKSYLTEKEKDCNEFVQQIHVVSFVQTKENGEYEDFTLYRGREKQDPYMITHLIREDGRAMGIGAVEHLFEAQWMSNHSAKSIKDHLDLASKLIFQTADQNYGGVNALNAIENGDILIHDDNKPLTQINNGSHDITSLQNWSVQWQNLAKEITSTPDAIRGSTMPSGTAYRQVAILNQEANSLFEIMTENKGLAIEEMMRKFIIPYIKTQLDTKEEISATLDDHNIKVIDTMFVKNEAVRRHNAKVVYEALNNPIDQPVSGLDIAQEEQSIQNDLNMQGNTRFIKPDEVSEKTWKMVFEDLEWDTEVEVTNEQSDKEAILTTLTTVMQTIGQNPAVLQDPNMKLLFNKILETAGTISAIEMVQSPSVQNQPIATQAAIQDLTGQQGNQAPTGS